MIKKRLYFIQANDVYGDDRKPSVYFPYAVGCLQAFLEQNEEIVDEYEFGRIIYRKEPIEQAVSSLERPFMVLFSCSVWNTEYNKAFARRLKELFSDCLVIFGGHNVSANGSEILNLRFVDFVIHNYGEESLCDLLIAIKGKKPLESVSNISFLSSDGCVITTTSENQKGIDYPSPYLSGVFDEIMKDNISFSGLLETNRGCPFNCAFCDWSTLKSKVRLFPMSRVKKEIDWFSEKKIEYVYCSDANFCLFQRDEEIVNYIIERKKKSGYPQVFKVNFTKNKMDFVFETGRKFHQHALDKAQTISFQSLNPETLAIIGRKNISVEEYQRLMQRYRENNIPTYCELIVGLPGETYHSFKKGVDSLIRGGQHYAMFIYPCEILPLALMNQPWYREKYKIQSIKIPFSLQHISIGANNLQIKEMTEIVTSTYSLPESDWKKCLMFSYFVQGLHNLGLLRQTAIFCANELDIGYDLFYDNLIQARASKEYPFLCSLRSKLEVILNEVIAGDRPLVSTCSGLGDMLWSLDEYVYFECYKNLKSFYEEMKEFVKTEFGDHEALDSLFKYQYSVVKKIGLAKVTIETDYDFYSYFNNIYMGLYKPLKKKKIKLEIKDSQPINSFSEFAREIIWYGRNKNKMDYTSDYYSEKVVFVF